MGAGFALNVATAAAIRRSQGSAPALVLAPTTEVSTFSTRIRPPLEQLGLRLGFDVFVYGPPQTAEEETATDLDSDWEIEIGRLFDADDSELEVPIPYDQPDDVWDDVRRLRPGLVALLGQTPDGLPGTFTEQIETWLEALPGDVPILRGWEKTSGRFNSVGPSGARRPWPSVYPAARLRTPLESAEAASQLLRGRAQIVSVTGRPGSGRTQLLSEITRQLDASGQPMALRLFTTEGRNRVDELQDMVELLASNEARAPEVVVIDDFDVVSRLGKKGSIDRDFIERVSLVSELEVVRFLVVLDDRYLDDLTDLDKKFAERIRHIRLSDLSRPDLAEIIRNEIGPHAEMAGYSLSDEVIEAALAPSASDEITAQPGLGIARVESAIARARRRKASTLSAEDFIPTTTRTTKKSAEELNAALRSTVKGQDQALETVAEHLSPALAGLKLRPERPHGVLFFVGPSGSGKTETAKQLASTVYGSADALIRLDMTEYANEEDARMKLIGASSVWKNSSTHGLLTTKVIAQPRSVVLLDEFEKAHPSVWNVFLQVFDEGRLTDGWGNVASFAETIVIMTSNLGVREGSARTAGFGGNGDFDSARQDAAITEAMPPELLNRITATVRYDALSTQAVREIARMELTRAFNRFSQSGWQIEFDETVIEWIARSGYDVRFGARHVQRTIESDIFPRIAALQSRQVRIDAEEDSLNVLEP